MPSFGNLRLNIKLLEKDTIIITKMFEGMADALNKGLRLALPSIEETMQELAYFWVGNQPELEALRSGTLSGHFGLKAGEGQNEVANIVDAIVGSIKIKLTPVKVKGKSSLSGGLTIYIQQSDFSNIYAAVAPVLTAQGASLNWIQWLLERGNDIIVEGFHIEWGNFGRSGQARMKVEGAWRVPPEYSGIADDNFITRAFEDKEAQIGRLIEERLGAKMRM